MRVETLLKRLKREFIKVNLLQACLDTLMFFLCVNLVLFLFSLRITGHLPNIQALVGLSTVFFLTDLAYRARTYQLELYEQKNPELHEILRTARDNLDKKNIVSQAMFDELMDRSRSVTSESIIPSKRIIQKVVVVGLLSFLTVISGLADFQIIRDSGGELIPDLGNIGQQEDQDDFELKNASEIYGEGQDIDVSDQLVDFTIEGEGESEESDLGSLNSRPEDVVLDVTGSSISEDMDLAKQYSLAIKDFN
jgi:hypothetical protein